MTSSKPEHLLRAPLPVSPQWEAGLQHRDLGGHEHSLHNGARVCMPNCVCIRARARVHVCVLRQAPATVVPSRSPECGGLPSPHRWLQLRTCPTQAQPDNHPSGGAVGMENGHKAQGTAEPSGGFHALPASLPIVLPASPPGHP